MQFVFLFSQGCSSGEKGRYSFEPKGLSIAPKTLANFLKRNTQLYEQGATVRRIEPYVCYGPTKPGQR